MSADYNREAALAQTAERAADHDERVAAAGIDLSPEGVRASWLKRERARAAKRAERAGRLDLTSKNGD